MRTIVRKALITVLRTESKIVLWKYAPKVIAITGSVGKTSTKDAVYAALSKVAYVRKSEKSYNSELGLPLTVLGIPNGWNDPVIWLKNIGKGLKLIFTKNDYPKWLILEVGVGKPGDMKETASWLKTDAVIITAIGETPAHIEFFKSRKHLIEEKAGLIDTLKPGGLLVLNRDDEAVLGMKSKTKNITLTYGFSPEADLRASGENIFYDEHNIPRGVGFRVDQNGASFPVVIEGVFGRNHVYASLAALAVSSGLGLSLIPAIEAQKNYDVPPGRMRLLPGIHQSLLIDDTYNSSPAASVSALETLGTVSATRKIAVLGDMLELGKHTVEAHKNIGNITREYADVLIVVGPIKDGALESGMDSNDIFEFNTAIEAGEFLKSFIKSGDLVLIKGSQGVRMERTVGEILLHQDEKKNLLVRQDSEWLNKK